MVDISNFCTEAAGILQFLGWVLTIIKIAIPLLIIFYGILDFGKAVVASKDDEIKKSTKSLMWRAISGIVIFFIPSIIMWLFGAVSSFGTMQDEANFEVCNKCVLSPWSSDCVGAVRAE